MNRWMNGIGGLIGTAVVCVAAGCGGETPAASGGGGGESTSWLLDAEPENVRPVLEAKADAAEGDTVTVLGRIGGRVEPITPDSPVFTIVDLELKYCGEVTPQACPTPWDYCCDPAERVAAHSATVMLVGADGRPLDVNPIAAGLSPLDEVVVTGTVDPRPNAQVLTIRATGVHVRGG